MKKLILIIALTFSATGIANETFQCPESFATESENNDALKRFVADMIKQHPDWTLEDVVAYRMELLKAHNCTETLRKINENN